MFSTAYKKLRYSPNPPNTLYLTVGA